MSWAISVDDMIIESTDDGLSSSIMPIIDEWIVDQDYMINVDPYPSAIQYDPTNESIVLAAHLDYFASIGAGGPNLIILHSDTGTYVDVQDESEEIELDLG